MGGKKKIQIEFVSANPTGPLHVGHGRGAAYGGSFSSLLAFAGWSSLPFIRFLKMPTLVMMGDKDTIVPLVNGQILSWALPDARLHVVEGGGHLFLVTRAAETADVINTFLQEPGLRAVKAA